MINNIYLGFNCFFTNHDFSISLIYDSLVKSIEIERINRLKYTPLELNIGDVEKGLTGFDVEAYFIESIKYVFKGLDVGKNTKIYILNSPFKIEYLHKKTSNIEYINNLNHHYIHACSAFYPSSFDSSAILCLDWVGTEKNLDKMLTQSLWKTNNLDIEFIEATDASEDKFGVGMVYSLISEIIGLEEGSVMGLSAYGEKNSFSHIELFEYTQNEVFLNREFLEGIYNINSRFKCKLADKEVKNLIISNIKNKFCINESSKNYKDITKSIYADLAYKLQEETQKAIVFLANRLYDLTQKENICLAGGVALNVISNTEIIKNTKFKNIFVQPASKDSGLSLGLAYHAYHIIGKNDKRINLLNPGLGNTYSDIEIKESLQKYSDYLFFNENKNNIYEEIGKYLADNKIVAWFSGGSEFGPRALGYRSILASPKQKDMKDRVNDIKAREKWRPLAPILLESDLQDYFETDVISPYMILVGEIKKEKLNLVPSIVHVDNTARYQTVNNLQNPRIYNLLKEFKKISGESILINTSFNQSKEPIVETPDDAIKMFLSSKLDLLVIENFIITKEKIIEKFKFNYEEKLRIQNKKIQKNNNYKRLEIYLGWKCNYKCVFCIERRFIDQFYEKKIEEKEVLKKLIVHKKLGYNHVTFLGGEPFIQSNFLFSLKVAKKLGYTVLVTTNGVLLPIENKAKTLLPYIDQLIISVPIIDQKLQPIINGVKNIIDFDKLFQNIDKYWNGNFLKINTVLNKYNYKAEVLLGILNFLDKYEYLVSEISFTYPDIDYGYYDEKHSKEILGIRYSKIKEQFEKLENTYKGNIKYKIIDVPFCYLPSEKLIKLSDDYNYQNRLKIKADGKNYKNGEYEIPRRRAHTLKCKGCKYLDTCWGPSFDYVNLYGDDDIKAIN